MNWYPSVYSNKVIGCLEALLIAQDTATWIQAAAKKAFQTLLVLSIDQRPKVRKRAQEAARKILTHPPPPTIQHPAASMTAEFCLRVLKECTKTDQQSALHVLALVKTIVEVWPVSASLPTLTMATWSSIDPGTILLLLFFTSEFCAVMRDPVAASQV
ncbi:hypothetical protein BC937DRAFT_88762 [Endogone sp. FLAS-F59071]|nr:hypothetical protein BC937DRAFT_88762 [Endogone sp. FLAS-F59071]|eukprot:RUS18456.1 hypothetical protein BC937DRAFT_88762 [Endogone sp. FLAS-F59071]